MDDQRNPVEKCRDQDPAQKTCGAGTKAISLSKKGKMKIFSLCLGNIVANTGFSARAIETQLKGLTAEHAEKENIQEIFCFL